ncbi:MAG: Fe-S cluster assembly protein SufD [Acidobacteria bacterium]|nr:Fe-S cluster assembly protein SufD [Acidobacteriota bacterium]
MGAQILETGAYPAAFDAFEKALLPSSLAWTGPLRRASIEAFRALGFPTTRDEEWRYTSVAPIAALPYGVSPRPLNGASARAADPAARLVPEGAIRLVFVNGHFAADRSDLARVPAGAVVSSLGSALEGHRPLVEPHLGRLAEFRSHAFTALNTAFMTDGAFVHVPRGTAIDSPVYLVFISAPGGGANASHPRNLVVAEEAGQVSVVEIHTGGGESAGFANAVTEIVVGPAAVVEHCRIGDEGERSYHVSTLQSELSRSATFTSHSIALGGALVRHDVNAVLAGEGADATLNGLYVLSGAQHVDHHTTIDHASPNGASRELYKGVLDGRSRGVFDGKIIVRPDAQKTDARQVNRNLILSEEALVDTKPQLEIRADDVKCTHAATIGQIDPGMLFYLRSRAVGEAEAREMLMRAFVSDVVSRVRHEAVRASLESLLAAKLGAQGRGRIA